MADPNVLYSSVAQASAAIVAILGGFVTSAVLNLDVRRRGIEEEIGDRERELALAQRESDEAWGAHEKLRAERLIWNWAEENLESRDPIPDATRAVGLLRAEDIRREEFDAAWADFRSDIRRVGRQVREGLKRHGPTTMLFHSWVEEHGLRFADEDLWLADKLYTRDLMKAVPPETKEPSEPRELSVLEQYGLDPSILGLRRNPVYEVENMRIEREAEAAHDAELGRHRDAFDEAERRVALASARLELLAERRRESRALPPDLRWGFAGLAFLALSGIVLPLALMPQSEADFRSEHKVAVIGLFVVGLVWVFGYFASLALVPRNRGRQESAGARVEGPG